MKPVRITADDLASILPAGGLTLVQGCSAESRLLASAVTAANDALGAMTFTGIFVGGINVQSYRANPRCRTTTFFLTPQLRAEGEAVEFLPLCYADILAYLRTRRIDAALFSVAPPDDEGMCSFGPVVDFLADLWPRIPVRIAHINPAMPRTRGHAGIPFSQLTAFIEGHEPLPTMTDEAGDPVADAIARHIAPFVGDGATLQTGLGKVPGTVLRALSDRRDLRIHSGLIGDAVLDLLEAGALAHDAPVTAGVAIGSQRLYDAIGGNDFHFRPVSHTHDAAVLSAIPNLITINSAIEIDLFGQAYAELGPKGLMSGPGGASDFARGAKAAGGLRIIALPAGAKGDMISRIVTPGGAAGPVSLGRMDVDIVVTEQGAADLRGLPYAARAHRLIAIAPPTHRETLEQAWAAYAERL